MAAKLRSARGHDDEVADPHGDLLVATRAHVGLARLERLDAPELGRLATDRVELDVHGSIILQYGPHRKLAAVEIGGSSAVVTGGASGLGEAAARALTERGATVVVVDLQHELGERLAKELGGSFVHTDVRRADQVGAAVRAAAEIGPLRVLVNCAGVGWASRTIGRDGSFEAAHDLEAFERVVSINLVGTFNCCRLAASAMSRTEPLEGGERGAIVCTASIAAFDGQVGQAAYSASKGGIVGMTLPVARDLAPAGIRVNTIAPGLIDTPIYGSGPGSQAFKEGLKRDVVFPKRLGTAREFASLALELVTNGYMNGEVVRLDGAARLQPKS